MAGSYSMSQYSRTGEIQIPCNPIIYDESYGIGSCVETFPPPGNVMTQEVGYTSDGLSARANFICSYTDHYSEGDDYSAVELETIYEIVINPGDIQGCEIEQIRLFGSITLGKDAYGVSVSTGLVLQEWPNGGTYCNGSAGLGITSGSADQVVTTFDDIASLPGYSQQGNRHLALKITNTLRRDGIVSYPLHGMAYSQLSFGIIYYDCASGSQEFHEDSGSHPPGIIKGVLYTGDWGEDGMVYRRKGFEFLPGVAECTDATSGSVMIWSPWNNDEDQSIMMYSIDDGDTFGDDTSNWWVPALERSLGEGPDLVSSGSYIQTDGPFNLIDVHATFP